MMREDLQMEAKMETTKMKVLVVGATGGSGRATIEALLAHGHEVTAFARRADRLQALSPRVKIVNGDAMNTDDLERAVEGQDAVIVALGISESPFRVRLRGSAGTPMNIRSAGTRNVIAAMHQHGVRKLVVQSSFGVGETRHKLPLLYRLFFKLVLKPQIADTERQEQVVRASGLDWVIAQPVNLTDRPDMEEAFASPEGEVRGMQISRKRVGRFLAETMQTAKYVGRSVALSAA
jgi:uncharacterized protein YbjT (DUF2867 family)